MKGIARTFEVVASIIFVVGFVGGLIIRDIYDFFICIAVWLAAFIEGLMLLGFAKIIHLLEENHDYLFRIMSFLVNENKDKKN